MVYVANIGKKTINSKLFTKKSYYSDTIFESLAKDNQMTLHMPP